MKERLSKMKNKKYETIKKVRTGEITKKVAENILNVTRRLINRFLIKLEKESCGGFIHKNKGRLSNNSIAIEIKREIIDLYKTKYFDLSYQMFKEMLFENENINVSANFLKSILNKEFLFSPYIHKITKVKYKNYLKKLMKKK